MSQERRGGPGGRPSVPPEVRGGMPEQARKAYAAPAERLYGTAAPPRSSEV
ncbi:MAG TPA: hypothetical protein VGJ19_17335 [Streptosporangiaceae bacterium]